MECTYGTFEMQQSIRAKTDEQINEALIQKAEALNNLLQSIKNRNEKLKQQLNNPISVLPNTPKDKQPSAQVIHEYFEAKRRLSIAQKRQTRLQLASQQLESNIRQAQESLAKQEEARMINTVKELSPTAAIFMNATKQERPRTQMHQYIELDDLDRQIAAARAIKAGQHPRASTLSTINITKMIEEEKAKKPELEQKAQNAIQQFKQQLTECLNGNPQVEKFAQCHESIVSSWSAFCQSYSKASKRLSELPYYAAINHICQLEKEKDPERIQNLLDSLSAEKSVIQDQLAQHGAFDETEDLRNEIDDDLVYLDHLTSVVGRALSKMSDKDEPVDPLELRQIRMLENEICS